MPASFILVVDDEPVITQTLVIILNRLAPEFVAIGSTNIEEAMQIVRSVRPDLVLLDVMMPGARGLRQAEEMRERWGCKVLLMSGQTATTDYLEDSAREGHLAFDIVAKPMNPNDLVDRVRQLLLMRPLASEWHNPLLFKVQ